MLTIDQALREARLLIDGVDARILLAYALQSSKEDLATHPQRMLAPEQLNRFRTLVGRRYSGEPVAYLTGTREFYGLPFNVTPDVLIPRPETELLVEQALEILPSEIPTTVLDLGTGSGAIAIAIAYHRPLANVTAVDISPSALSVASSNALQVLGAASALRLTLVQGHWYMPVANRRFDLIVSNPPYIAGSDPHLLMGDLRFEPPAALTPGGDGLDAIRHIVATSIHHLNRGGRILFEHGYDQGETCRTLLAASGFQEITTIPDFAAIPRITGGILKYAESLGP